MLVQSLPLGALADNARLDWTVFWASMAAALARPSLIAIVPGVALWRGSNLQATMATTRTGGIAGRGGRLEGGLVVAQMALAVLLAAGAGLLIRSVANLRAIDPGVETCGVVDRRRHDADAAHDAEERRRTITDMLPSLAGAARRHSVAATQKLPLRGSGDNWGMQHRGQAGPARATTAFRMVTRDYFTAIGMPIRARPQLRSDRTARAASASSSSTKRSRPSSSPARTRSAGGCTLSTTGRAHRRRRRQCRRGET